MLHPRRAVSVAAALATAACVQVLPSPPAASPTVGAAPVSSRAADSAKADSAKLPEGYKKWADATKDAQRIEGYLTLYRKREKVYLAITPDQLDRDMLLVTQVSQGIGDLGLDGGTSLPAQLVRLRRTVDHIEVVLPNPYVQADPETPMSAAVGMSFGPSIAAALKIESINDSTGALLAEITPFFTSDFPAIGPWFQAALRTGTTVDAERSRIIRVTSFSRNTEVEVQLTYRPGQNRFLATVPDARWITIGVHYSFLALPETAMTPRPADDRVGYFVSAHRNFSRDTAETFFVRLVNRWRLEPADPSADAWQPKNPITYYIDRSVPVRWRPYVRAGILEWNRAFEAAGWRDAVQVLDAPIDSSWSAEDARFSTVRWIATRSGAYAVGPTDVDPRTGEILNADILVTASWIQTWQGDYQAYAGPTALAQTVLRTDSLIRVEGSAGIAHRRCAFADGMAARTTLVRSALAGSGRIAPGEPIPEQYIGQALKQLIMHEVGHTLGLRHNFRGSSGIPNARLHDTTYTANRGVSISVMDYSPPNVAPRRDDQGEFYSTTLGSYDYWAIRYGYSRAGGDAVGRAAIAAEASNPAHLYGSDEDIGFGPFAFDPTISAWDLGADPVAWARGELTLIDEALASAEARIMASGDGYPKLRSAVSNLLFQKWYTLLVAQKSIAGTFTSRDHKGDPGQRLPFQVAPVSYQRAGLDLLVQHGFAETAFALSPDLLSKLAPDRWFHWDANPFLFPRIDFPYLETVRFYQGILLEFLHDPMVLARVRDAELRVRSIEETLTIPEIFGAVKDAVWSEIANPGSPAITATRRDLQRVHLNTLARMVISPFPGLPEDARSVARTVLADLADSLRTSIPRVTDPYGRSHLTESLTRIERVLDADMVMTANGLR